MSISYRGVYLTPSTYDYQACRLSDISFYATHLYALFESSFYACPSNIALELANEKVSYEALASKVNLCAAGFQTLGVEQGDVIVFSMEKSVSLIVGMLAALKIGAKICVLPPVVSALRLRAIQQLVPVTFFINDLGEFPDYNDEVTGMYLAPFRSVSYNSLISEGLRGGSMTVPSNAFMTAAQLMLHCDDERGLYVEEFSQAYFLKSVNQLEDVYPSYQSSQKIITTALVTQTNFLIDLFYAFSRQFTCVLLDKTHDSAPAHSCSREIEIQGMQISLNEIEYFARQYPGVTEVAASFSDGGLELYISFAWGFYSVLTTKRIVTPSELISPKNDADRLACRLFYFLTQYFSVGLPIKMMVLQPE